MGNFSISHYASIQIDPGVIDLHYIIDVAEIPTFQEIQEKGIVPQVGSPGMDLYLAGKAEELKKNLFLEINGGPVEIHTERSEAIFPPGAGGLPTMKIGVHYKAYFGGSSSGGINRLDYRDENFPGRAGWKEVIASGSSKILLSEASVPDKDRSVQLTDYPTDLMNSPPQVLRAHLMFAEKRDLAPIVGSTEGGAMRSASLQPEPLRANRQPTPRSRFTELVASEQLSSRVVVLALLIATCLGAMHALEPGHGKTIVAAYLVGSRGTAWDAVSLGFIVTGSHTAGVYIIGLITLYASRYVVAERLYPWLGILSGLIITALGVFIFFDRYSPRGHSHAHDHSHGHAHGNNHARDHDLGHRHVSDFTGLDSVELDHREQSHCHSHGGHAHDHHYVEAGGAVSFGRLLTLGVTGGIIPCPAALVVLLSAVAFHRVGFGLLLILAFSIGLAAVLIAIGMVMVYARRTVSRFSGENAFVTRWLPLTSAAIVTIFGLTMTIQALFALHKSV
jgi:nickel/cobalt transporter (NicO) family protein